ncbi:MAG: metallophosphoesterase family protein [Candidatus Krumholzibacteriia bacterium]
MTRVGIISDTHGLLRPEAAAALAGSDLVLHAGDIGRPEILAHLGRIAPVTAVRGNVDEGAWAWRLPEWVTEDVGGVRIHLRHIREEVSLNGDRVDMVVTGHSHRPHLEQADGVVHLNPGSAGPRRFRLPATVALLEVVAGRVAVQLVELPLASDETAAGADPRASSLHPAGMRTFLVGNLRRSPRPSGPPRENP